MIDLGIDTDLGILGLDEVADACATRKLGARAQTRERTDVVVAFQHGAVDDAVRRDVGAGTDGGIADHAVGTDDHIIRQGDVAFEDAADIDADVSADDQLAAHVDACRIGQAGAFGHQAVGLTTLEGTLEIGQLQAVVDALHFLDRRRLGGGDVDAFAGCHGDDVGQVVLALGIVGGQRRQPALELGTSGGEDTGVAFLDGQLLRRGILVLYDGADAAFGVTHDTAIACRVFQNHRQQAQSLLTDFGQQRLEGLATNQRHIAIQDQHLAITDGVQ